MKDISLIRIFRYALAIFICLFFVANVLSNEARATTLYSESFLFSGTNVLQNIPTASVNVFATANRTGAIDRLWVDFDDGKVIDQVVATGGMISTSGASVTPTLNAGANGMNSNFTQFTAYVNSIRYGSGIIGWQRTVGNNFSYYVIFDDVDIPYAETLTLKQRVYLNYDQDVFTPITIETGATSGQLNASFNYVALEIATHSGTFGQRTAVYIYDNTMIFFNFFDTATVTANNITSSLAYINLTKDSVQYGFNISNATGYEFYGLTNTDDVSQLLDFSGGISFNLHHIGLDSWVNRTIFDANGDLFVPPAPPGPGEGGSVSGQVTYIFNNATIGNSYGINVNVTATNFTAFTTFYLYAYKPDGNLEVGFPISFTTQNYTTGKFYTFVAEGNYNTSLKYCSTTDITCSNVLKFNLHTLDFATVFVSPVSYAYSITTDKDSYVPGETILFTINNPSPTKIYMDVFEGNINTGFGVPSLGINVEIPAGASNYPISKEISQSITKGDYTVYLISNLLTDASFNIYASKSFNITTPGNTTNVVFIGWDRQTYNLGNTGKLTTVTDWSTDYIYVLSPSGVNKTYIYPANSTNNTMVSFNEIGVWKAWITNNSGVNFYANASVFAGAPIGNETFANCLFAADYVCWDNTQYEQGDPYVLSFRLRITTLTTYNPYIAVYNPNGKIIANISINGSYDSTTNTYVGSSSGSFTPQAVTGIYWARLMPDQLNREGARSSAAATVIARVSVVPTAVGETTSTNLLNSGFFAALLLMIVFVGIGMEIGGGMGAIVGFGGGFIMSAIYDLVPTWSVYLFAILILTAFAVMVGSKVTGGGNGGGD